MIKPWGINIWPFFMALLTLGLASCSGVSSFFQQQEPVTLKFVYLKNSADYQALADMFHDQHRNITIQLVPIEESGNAMQSFQSEATKADAIRLPASWPPEVMSLEVLTLDSILSTSRDFPYDDFFPGSLDALKLDGHQVGIPAGLNPYVIFYHPEKFRAAGMQPPQPGWRLDDFISQASAINKQGKNVAHVSQSTYGFCTHPLLADPVIFTYLLGGGIVDDPRIVTLPTLNTQVNIDAVKWYVSLKSDYGILPGNTRNMRNISLWIGSSNCGFWMDSLDRSIFGQRIKDPVGMLPLPRVESRFELFTLDLYAIIAGSEHSEEAFQWISFLVKQQEAAGRLIPPLQSQIDSKAYASRASEEILAIARSLQGETIFIGFDMYHDNRFGTALSLFNQAVAQALEGSSDVESALNEAQTQAEKEFMK